MNIVSCPCGHALGQHHEAGCSGDTFRPGCSCTRDRNGALDAAIDDAKAGTPDRARAADTNANAE